MNIMRCSPEQIPAVEQAAIATTLQYHVIRGRKVVHQRDVMVVLEGLIWVVDNKRGVIELLVLLLQGKVDIEVGTATS